MDIAMAVGLLVLGFIFLVKGADFFVDGSSSVAKKLRVPSLIIGLTIVAMGTSLPEFSVSLSAAIKGQNALAISNVIGSNMFNLMVVLGFSALFQPLLVSRDVFKRDYPLSIIATGMLFVFGFTSMKLDRLEGAVMFACLIIYLVVVVREAMKVRKAVSSHTADVETMQLEAEADDETNEVAKETSTLLSIIYIIGGAIAIKFGGEWVVDGAVTIAKAFGISQNIIGLTIVAMGTSLPELVTSVVAARKGELDMSIGNVVGSNIFNIFGVLGMSGAISSISVISDNLIDLVILVVFSLIVGVLGFTKRKITKGEGVGMLVLYAIYAVYICIR
ncbi:MAG: calcium/sodium antiporter [Lachnospiraceae bacterium]|nr:calcium/sodium antiporter [Lachnospiraceae bacterium]